MEPPPQTSPAFSLQTRLFEQGIAQLQSRISQLDEILFKIKAAAITVWVALIGWAFSAEQPLIVPLGFVVIIGFWLLEGMFRGIQIRYLEAAHDLYAFINDSDRMQKACGDQCFPKGLVYPLSLRDRGNLQRLLEFGHGIFSSTVATLYLFLSFTNLLVWMVSATPQQ